MNKETSSRRMHGWNLSHKRCPWSTLVFVFKHSRTCWKNQHLNHSPKTLSVFTWNLSDRDSRYRDPNDTKGHGNIMWPWLMGTDFSRDFLPRFWDLRVNGLRCFFGQVKIVGCIFWVRLGCFQGQHSGNDVLTKKCLAVQPKTSYATLTIS